MTLYTENEASLIKENLGDIIDKSVEKQNELLEPTMKEWKQVMEIIIDFIRRKKRMIYGGYALNKEIEKKNKKDSFYSELDRPDIEFYSYEPLQDLVELTDLLYS